MAQQAQLVAPPQAHANGYNADARHEEEAAIRRSADYAVAAPEPWDDGAVLQAVEAHLDQQAQDPEVLQPGVEVTIGAHTLHVLDVLGSGSYSVVWRAEVVASLPNTEGEAPLEEREVALKDVLCKSHAALRQSLFEVQLLLALERRALTSASAKSERKCSRLPRCHSYKVGAHREGWSVRMALSRLPGEQLDDWLRRAATAVVDDVTRKSGKAQPTWTSEIARGVSLAEHLVKQLGPALEHLAPLAWHRDVNSHNILISDSLERTTLDPKLSGDRSAFWLCDLGLAVDSRGWVSDEGEWRVTDIGGDCRYWPASSWMVHLYGADYLLARQDYCRQYQTRLDIHGLGITAVELLCSIALSARAAGAPEDEGFDRHGHWKHLLDSWQRYHETVGEWWETIYKVFSVGGDFRPVHSWLVQEAVADQVIAMIKEIRQVMHDCASCTDDPRTARLLRVVADLTDEASKIELSEACEILERDIFPETSATGGPNKAGNAAALTPGAALGVAAQSAIVSAPYVPPAKPEVTMETAPQVLSPPGEDAASLAAAAAQEGRRALENLAPIPSIAASVAATRPTVAERGRQMSRRSRQEELAELKDAQGQLRRDLEQLQRAKLRLQYAKQLHEARQAQTSGPPSSAGGGGSNGTSPATSPLRTRMIPAQVNRARRQIRPLGEVMAAAVG